MAGAGAGVSIVVLMRRSGYTTYAATLSAEESSFKASSALGALVVGAPIIWAFREANSSEIPQCNVPATRFLHEAIARCKSRSVGSARTYGSHLASWFRYCDESAIDPSYPILEHITGFREWLQESDEVDQGKGRVARDALSVPSINGILVATVSYYKWAFKKGLVEWDPMLLTDRKGRLLKATEGITQRLETNQILLAASDRREPRYIPTATLHAILGELPVPYRLCAMSAVSCGMRASEVADLPLAALKPSIDLSDGEFIALTIRGKGGVVAPVYVPSGIYARLLHYRDFTRWETINRLRRKDRSYVEPKTLFVTERYGRSFSGRTLAKAFYRANDSLGYIIERYHFHGLRHTYAYTLSAQLLAANEEKRRTGTAMFDVQGVVQERMRHANPNTTDIYLRVGIRDRVLLSIKIDELYDKFLHAS